VGRRSQPQTHLAMNLLLLLAVAIPLSCLAFVSWLALLGVMTLGAVINVIAITRSGGTLHVNEHTAVVADRALRFGFSVAAYLLLAFFVAIVVQSLASWLFD
jgi:formate hydrogenlyase subunit 4